MQVENQKPNTEDETQSFDTDAALSSISSDLFPGQGGDEEKGQTAEGSESASGAETVEASPTQLKEGEAAQSGKEPEQEGLPEGENSPEVQAVGAPKTWNKEELATWATVPKEVQDKLAPILARREEDFYKGIGIYKEAAEIGARYDQVVEPYRAILAAENVDPVGLFQAFAANHYLLSRGTEEQKLELTANLINGYQIDFGKLAEFLGSRAYEPPNAEIIALRKELSDLKSGFTQQSQAAQERLYSENRAQIDKFADDGQHPLFDEVATDMAKLMEAGLATDLQDAYDKAVFANPATRAKELTRLRAEETERAKAEEKEREDKRRKSMGDHVKTTPTNRNGTVPLGSMDDTLTEKLAEIRSRG